MRRLRHAVGWVTVICGILACHRGNAAEETETPATGAPASYEARAIEATVVDADTGVPLEGVIVDAHWRIEGDHASPLGEMMVLETVTDARGRFRFPAWGPKPRPNVPGQVMYMAPQLLLFKAGYTYKSTMNDPLRGPFRPTLVLDSDWNGKTIRLEPFKGTPEEYALNLLALEGDVQLYAFYTPAFGKEWKGCEWKSVPLMLAAIFRQKREFDRNGIRNFLPLEESLEDAANPARCGSFRAFMEKYKQ